MQTLLETRWECRHPDCAVTSCPLPLLNKEQAEAHAKFLHPDDVVYKHFGGTHRIKTPNACICGWRNCNQDKFDLHTQKCLIANKANEKRLDPSVTVQPATENKFNMFCPRCENDTVRLVRTNLMKKQYQCLKPPCRMRISPKQVQLPILKIIE